MLGLTEKQERREHSRIANDVSHLDRVGLVTILAGETATVVVVTKEPEPDCSIGAAYHDREENEEGQIADVRINGEESLTAIESRCSTVKKSDGRCVELKQSLVK